MPRRPRRLAALSIIGLCLALLLEPLAALAAPQAFQLFVERFSSHAALDAVKGAVWDTGAAHLRLDYANGVERIASGAAACADGSVVVVGQYRMDDTTEVFAQRLDSRGYRLWPADVRVSAGRSNDDQTNAGVVVNAACQSIVVWQETGMENQVFAQKLNASGVPQWASNLQVNTLQARYPQVAAATADRIVIAYLDHNDNLLARQINWDGVFTWSDEKGINAGCAECRHLALAADGAGNVAAAWSQFDSRYNERSLFAQKLDPNGVAQWDFDLDQPVFTVNQDAGESLGSLALAAAADGAALVWLKITNDSAGGAADVSVYAQRLGSAGETQWTEAQLLAAFSAAGGGSSYQERQTAAAIQPSGIMTAAWTDERSGAPQVYAQKISLAGAKQWSQDVRISAAGPAEARQSNPALAQAGAGLVFAAWSDAAYGPAEAFAQIITAAGGLTWTANQRIFAANGNLPQSRPSMAYAADGGSMIAFADDRRGVASVYLQKLTAAGAPQWGAGLRLSQSGEAQTDPALAADSAGSAFVAAWVDARHLLPANIYAQKLNTSGARQWGSDARVNDPVRTPGERLSPRVAVAPGGAAYITWQERQSGQARQYLQKLGADGARLWASDLLLDAYPIADDGLTRYDLMVDPAGQFVYVAWDTSYNLLAQKVSAAGAAQWSPPAVVYDTLIYDAALAVGPDALPVIAWTPALPNPDMTYNVYAQKLDASGAALWDTGVQVSQLTGPNIPVWVDIAINAAGRAAVVWDDSSYGVDGKIYAQALNAAGVRQWAQDARVDDAPSGAPAWEAVVSLDQAGQAVIAWLDHRNGFGDLYTQKLSAAGARQWTADTRLIAPEGFFLPGGLAQSAAIDSLSTHIATARLEPRLSANSGAAQFYLSNNGGANWFPVAAYRPFQFPTTGSDLRWRVQLASSADQTASPVITQVSIAYNDGGVLPAIFLPLVWR